MSGVDYVFKLLTLGESTVGKSSIILRYTNGQFNQNLLSTTGIDFKTKIIEHKNEKIYYHSNFSACLHNSSSFLPLEKTINDND